jgi:hypothetical protein
MDGTGDEPGPAFAEVVKVAAFPQRCMKMHRYGAMYRVGRGADTTK